MNKIFKVKWNAACQRYDVTSEFARGKTKSSVSGTGLRLAAGALSVAGALLISPAAVAADVMLDTFDPKDGGHVQTISGPLNTLTAASWGSITTGQSGFTYSTFADAVKNGYLKGSGINYLDQQILTGVLAGFDYYDKQTGTVKTFEAYNNDDISEFDGRNNSVPISYAVGKDGHYVDRNLIQLSANSEATVSVGSKTSSDWFYDPLNFLQAILKGSKANPDFISSIFKLTSADPSAPATLNYDSKTVIFLGNNGNVARPETQPYSSFKAGYTGTFSSAIGTRTVSNIDELKDYNQALIDAVQNGTLDPSLYRSEFSKAFEQTLKYTYIDYTNNPIPQDDAVWQDINFTRVAFILAEGAGAQVNIKPGANILARYSDTTTVRLNDGATLNNDGTIESHVNTTRGSMGVYATGGSVVNNRGAINAGSSSTLPNASQGINQAIYALDSTVNNSGIVNVGPRGSLGGNQGITLRGSSTFSNTGNINVVTLEEPSGIANASIYTRGVLMEGNSVFDNDGEMYMGRQAQSALNEAVSDVSVKTSGNRLADVSGGGTFRNNAGGTMTLGSLVQGASIMVARGSAAVAQNAGTLTILGRAPGVNGQAPLQNAGMVATEGAVNVVNAGLISLKGINAVAMQAISKMTDRAGSAVRNEGTIEVETGVDPVTGTANYGLWAEGAMATATNAGTINLEGERAIAAHARSGGELVVEDGAAVNFRDKNQTGYYVFGAGSGITDNSTGMQDVSTEGSTLYRIDGGASFDGSGTGTQVGVSGKNATGLLVTGAQGAGSTLDTGNMNLNVTGEGATGIRVAGDARGVLAADTTINLSGAGSSAGIVENTYTDISGNQSQVKGATLTTFATLNSANAAPGAVGYIARNGGTLDHRGTIDFTAPDTTGVQVEGGVLDNSGSIRVNGTAVDVSGADSVVTNSGTVEATDGTAAFRVRDGAGLDLSGSGTVRAGGSAHGVLLDSGATGLAVEGATIEMKAGGTGNAIENAAEIEGIQLKDTTITVGDGYGVRTAATLAEENSGTITVSGAGAGLYFGRADGSESDKEVDTSRSQGLVINVDSAQGSGVVTNTRGDVKSGASVNVNDAAGGAALVVKGSTRNVEQSGTLTSQSLTSAVVDVSGGSVSSFINRGVIQAAGAAYDALRVASGSYLNFTNARGGHITGRVALADGNNSVTLEGGSTADDVTTGSGNDNFYLSGIRPSDTGLYSSLQAGAGADTLNLSDSVLTVTDPATLTGFETVALLRGSEFTLDGTLLPLGDAQDDAAGTGYDISGDSTLRVLGAGSTAFNSFLRGAGTVAADAAGGAFDFTANNSAAAGRDFTGTLALTDATFALGGLNAQALAAARLLAGAGSIVSVADGVQRTGGLAFDGGTLAFNTGTPGESAAKSSVQTANLLDLSGSGTVQVNAGTVDNAPVLPPDTLPLMAQDDANTLLKLAGSDGAVTGSGGNLVLKDQNGNVISNALHTQVTQNGQAVANATYDYRLTGGAASDGLYANYGLTALELLTAGSDALVLDARGLTGSAADMSAVLSGRGDLAIDTGAGQTVSLSNAGNSYTGRTDVRSGTLQMGNDNVLGQTSELALAAGTTFDMNGHSQTVGMLNTLAGSLTNLNGGSLTLSQGGTADGRLQGAGALNVTGGTLTVKGSNAGLTATTSIAGGAAAELDDVQGLGSGGIVNDGLLALKRAAGKLVNRLSGSGEVALDDGSDVVLTGDNRDFGGRFTVAKGSALTATGEHSLGTAAVTNEGQLNLNGAASWLLENSITGAGALAQNGSGVVTLSDAAARYTGDTRVNAGGLQLGTAGQAVTLASDSTDVAAGAAFGGFGGTAGNVNNAGTLQLGTLGPATRAAAGATDFTVGGDLTSSGTLMVAQPGVAGSLLHVKGDYTGNGGRLVLNTALGGDGSLTDRLLIDGDTRGTTAVTVNNAGGSGAKTIDGIEVITVRGKSEGEFTQQGRIVAGAYEYHLARGDAENSANWYLRNTAEGEGGGSIPGENDDDVVRVYRPEAGAYIANLAAANTLFSTRLHDRLGETHYTDALTGEKKVTSMWLRNTGGHTRFADSSGQQKTQANRYVMQLGGDVAQWSSDGADRYHLGVMAGYANQHSSTQNHVSGQSAKGSIRGYNAGLYGTWLQDNAEKTGAYVDTWAQYSWFDGSVQGDSLAPESYKAKGFTASVESGYTWKIGEKNARESYYLQPKAQVTWSGVKADDIRESNGTRVSGTGEGNVQTRLGVRAFIKGHSAIDEGKNRTFQPFIEANWIANTKPYGVNLNGVDVRQKGTRNAGELKLGVEGQIKPGVELWGNVAQQMGGSGYSDTGAMLGLKVSF